jgi:hypothetical protein
MQIVNGYVCMNCCDVDKVRLGQDPHQSTDQLKKQTEQRLDPLASGKFGPAVTFGGALGNAPGADGASGGAASAGAGASSPSADGSDGAAPSFNLNILV